MNKGVGDIVRLKLTKPRLYLQIGRCPFAPDFEIFVAFNRQRL